MRVPFTGWARACRASTPATAGPSGTMSVPAASPPSTSCAGSRVSAWKRPEPDPSNPDPARGEIALERAGIGEQHGLPARRPRAFDVLFAVIDEQRGRRLDPEACDMMIVDGGVGLDQPDLSGNGDATR